MDYGKMPQRFLWLVKNSLAGDLYREFRQNRFRRKWRKKNPYNETTAESLFAESKVTVGKYSYGPLNVVDYGNTSNLHIGNYVSIAHGVTFLLNSDHYVDRISTFPFRVKVLKEKSEVVSKGISGLTTMCGSVKMQRFSPASISGKGLLWPPAEL